MGKRLGLNYLWGLLNFAAGVASGGIYVAAVLIAHFHGAM